MFDTIETILGVGEEALTWWQMSIRAAVVFLVALIILRIGNHRIFGKNSAFDIVLGIIYGSILSRAITGNSPFWPTLTAGFVLVLLHKLVAVISYYSDFGFGDFVKGERVRLVDDGKLDREMMEEQSITKTDLKEAMRQAGSGGDLKDIQSAFLERSGKISVIMKSDKE